VTMDASTKLARGDAGSLPQRLRKRAGELLARHTSSLLMFMVLCVVLAVGAFMIGDLHTASVQVQRMYAGSVQGLRRIGELQYEAQETRRSTLYALTTNDSNLQVEYADQSRAADQLVTEGIARYLAEARVPREIEVGKRLQADWSAYLKVRDEVLASILEGSTKEAVDLDLTGGVPSFDRVRQDLEEVKRLYDEQAADQRTLVDVSSRRSVIRLVGVLSFTLLFASASVWAIQRSKMLNAVRLAKLQMDFVASVSHELRTPLAVICASAQNIADGVVDQKEQLARYGSVIRHHSTQLTELINQILQFAATHEGRNRYTLKPVDVEAVITSVLTNTRELAEQAGAVVEKHIAQDLPPVMADFRAVCQCLQNLVINALKYGGKNPPIAIRALGTHGENGRADEVSISVEDHGIGIDSADLKQIFQPFYRSPAVMAAQIHGTGLGLPLAKSIAEAMGGRISVVSKLGMGSRFTLHLPVAHSLRIENQVEQRVLHS
jgi:signal transduction histidine kinase